MASQVQLINRALIRIGVDTITDINENSAPAIAMKLVYQAVLDEMIEQRHWSFARKRVALAKDLTVTLPTNWAFAYSAPSDMANVIGIEPVTYFGPEEYYRDGYLYSQHYMSMLSPEYELREGRILFSNIDDAVLIYTGKVTDSEKLTASFARAFTERLAAEVVMPLKDDERRYEVLKRAAETEYSRAAAHDMNLQPNQSVEATSLIDARL